MTDFIIKLLRRLTDRKIETDGEKRDLASLFMKEFDKFEKEHKKKLTNIFLRNTINYFLKGGNTHYTTYIDINNRCNLNCPTCQNEIINKEQVDLTWSLEQMNNVFKTQPRMIFISGGEPFMNPNLLDALEQNQDRLFFVFTNGTMTDEYKKLIEKGLTNVVPMFSIDGDKEYHDEKRGKGSFNKLMSSINLFCTENYPYAISSVVDSNNIDYLFSKDYIDFVKGLDANAITFLKNSRYNSEEFLDKYYQKSQELAQSLGMTFPIFNMPYMEHQFKRTDGYCVGGTLHTHINAHGEVTRCPFDLTVCGHIDDNPKTLSDNLQQTGSHCAYDSWVRKRGRRFVK